ncbi:TetR/AcrR family transcriptional regulator [Nocardiopsis terrae]
MATEPGRRRRSTPERTREHLLDSAAEVLRELGMARATTKEIARAAGYSEATLYKHFTDKSDLLLAVMRHRFPPFVEVLAELPGRVGRKDVRGTLLDLVPRAVAFYRHGAPMLGSLFADPGLLARHREGMAGHGAGPLNVNRALAAYLDDERALGRLPTGVDPGAAASLLVGACFQRGFLEAFLGHDDFPPIELHAAELVDTLLRA